MRITNPITLAALSTGLLALTAPAPAQGGLTEQMREEIRSIVRQEIRAALRDLRPEPRRAARPRETDRRPGGEQPREKAEDRARSGFGVAVRGDDSLRWIGRAERRPRALEVLELELEEIGDILEEIEVQLDKGLKDIELPPLPRIELKLDGLEGLRTDEEVERRESGVRFFRVGGRDRGDAETEGKVGGRAKVKVWTGGGELLDETFETDGNETDGKRPGAVRVWVDGGKLHIDKGGDVDVFHLHGPGDRKGGDDAEVEKAGQEPATKDAKRRPVRRRTMV